MWSGKKFDQRLVYSKFSLVQDGISALGKARMRSTPSLSDVSPTLPLKQFQCSSD